MGSSKNVFLTTKVNALTKSAFFVDDKIANLGLQIDMKSFYC